MGLLKRLSGQHQFEQAMATIAEQAEAAARQGGGYVEVNAADFPLGGRRLPDLAAATARYLAARGFQVGNIETPQWGLVARVHVLGRTDDRAASQAAPVGAGVNSPLTDPVVRQLVRAATVEGNYGAVCDVYHLLQTRVPSGKNIWTWWMDELEVLAQSHDADLALYVKFARDAGYMDPWGDLPDGTSDRLHALGG